MLMSSVSLLPLVEFTRIAQEVLLKQESTSANLVLGSLADAETNDKVHVKNQVNDNVGFTLADFNSLIRIVSDPAKVGPFVVKFYTLFLRRAD